MPRSFEAVNRWPLSARLLVIAGLSALIVAGVLLLPDQFLVFIALGIGVSAVAGYWLGRRWFLVPLAVMAGEIAVGIPATLVDPDGETPFSVILEAPFWTGIPALIGAMVGAAVRALAERRTPPAAHATR